MEKLKKCPFCGGRADEVRNFSAVPSWTVFCVYCPAQITASEPDGARDQWNTRPLIDITDAAASLRAALVAREPYTGAGYTEITEEEARALADAGLKGIRFFPATCGDEYEPGSPARWEIAIRHYAGHEGE